VIEPVRSILDFLQTGGFVLWGIFLLSSLLWGTILERYWFHYRVYPRHAQGWILQWNERRDKKSWYARKIRKGIISRARLRLEHSLVFIKTLIVLGPLFGLMGTVTGMMEVFDMMALTGDNDARVLASGISRATLTTMAGLLIALTGMYPAIHLRQRAKRETERLTDTLQYQEREP